MVSRQAHNLKFVGSIPASPICSKQEHASLGNLQGPTVRIAADSARRVALTNELRPRKRELISGRALFELKVATCDSYRSSLQVPPRSTVVSVQLVATCDSYRSSLQVGNGYMGIFEPSSLQRVIRIGVHCRSISKRVCRSASAVATCDSYRSSLQERRRWPFLSCFAWLQRVIRIGVHCREEISCEHKAKFRQVATCDSYRSSLQV